MPNSTSHSSNQFEPARLNTLPPIQDINLREILDRFSEDPELLKAVLKAKRDELKLRAEEINFQSEKVRLEIRRLDHDGVKDDTSPVSQYTYHSPPKSTYAYSRGGYSHNLGCYATQVKSSNGNKGFMQRHLLDYGRDESNTLPPLYHNIEANHDTIKLNDAPARPLHQSKRRPGREKVLEALRNKLQNNSSKRAKSNTAGPVLPPIKSSYISTSGVHISPNNAQKPHHTPLQTLSALQPRELPSTSSSFGPFSAPVGGPHPEFQFPPSAKLDSIPSKHPTPES